MLLRNNSIKTLVILLLMILESCVNVNPAIDNDQIIDNHLRQVVMNLESQDIQKIIVFKRYRFVDKEAMVFWIEDNTLSAIRYIKTSNRKKISSEKLKVGETEKDKFLSTFQIQNWNQFQEEFGSRCGDSLLESYDNRLQIFEAAQEKENILFNSLCVVYIRKNSDYRFIELLDLWDRLYH